MQLLTVDIFQKHRKQIHFLSSEYNWKVFETKINLPVFGITSILLSFKNILIMLYIWQGHRFGYDRSTCDKMFLNHMLATCTGRKRLVNCQHSAEIFWSAVRVGAYFHYHETAPAYCSEPWISQCLAWKITCIQNSFFVYILLTYTFT